jgi:hypothetical protein
MAQTTTDVTTLLAAHHAIIRYTKGGAKNDTTTARANDVATCRGDVHAHQKDLTTNLRDYIKATD